MMIYIFNVTAAIDVMIPRCHDIYGMVWKLAKGNVTKEEQIQKCN